MGHQSCISIIYPIKLATLFHSFTISPKMAVSKERLVFAYPLNVLVHQQWTEEIFVTFEEPNIFEDPHQSIELKTAATMDWVVGFLVCSVIFNFVYNEVQGYASKYRSIINQLVSMMYIYVAINSFIPNQQVCLEQFEQFEHNYTFSNVCCYLDFD